MRVSRAAHMGLDLSARAAAAVSVPSNWTGSWGSEVSSLVVDGGQVPHDDDMARVLRTIEVAERLVDFAKQNRVEVAWIEGYAFRQNNSAHTVAEVGGVVRAELVRAGVEVRTVMMQTARKLLLGKLPRPQKKAKRKRGEPKPETTKDLVAATLRAAGIEFRTLDEYDAMAVLNWGMAQRGRFFFAQPEPDKGLGAGSR